MGKHRTKAPNYQKTPRRSRIKAMADRGYIHLGGERFGRFVPWRKRASGRSGG